MNKQRKPIEFCCFSMMFRFFVKKANKIDEHVIIEANAGVIKRGEQWAKDQPNKVFGNIIICDFIKFASKFSKFRSQWLF
jgi:hypothetical protein